MGILVIRLRRPLAKVALLALAASFGAVGAADAWGLHDCPHHDRLPGSAEGHAAAAAHGDAAGVEFHAGHGTDEGPEHGHGPCTCIGGVCSAGAAAAHARGGNDDVARGAALPAVPAPSAAAAQLARAPYLHPFPNAPPVA